MIISNDSLIGRMPIATRQRTMHIEVCEPGVESVTQALIFRGTPGQTEK
jgi:hypothetical protein